MAELNGESLSFSENPSAKNEEDSFSHGKSGGSLRSQSGTLKEGKSGGSQGSGQNGIHINENIYESSSFSENPVAGSPGSVGLGKSGGSSGSGQNGSQTKKWLVPSLMQLPVCFALIAAGFNFDDLSSTVVFLYAYHYIMMAFQASFRFFFHQDPNENVCLPIEIFNTVIRVILQIWSLIGVSGNIIWQNSNDCCEKTPTVIAAIIIVGIELVLVVIMVVNICEKFGARMSNCLWGKRSQNEKLKPTNSRTPRDNNEPNEDQDGLLNSNNTDTE